MLVLEQTTIPLAPQEIFKRGKVLYPKLGLVTVYRTLELFDEFELACRVHFQEGCHGYLPAQRGHHHRILCEQCGKSIEFSGHNDLDALIARVQIQTGYQVSEHLLQLFGVCPHCQKKIALTNSKTTKAKTR